MTTRFVKGFYNELASEWIFNVEVTIIPAYRLCGIVSTYLGTVEYLDGTFLDIYNQCGQLVGVEWG